MGIINNIENGVDVLSVPVSSLALLPYTSSGADAFLKSVEIFFQNIASDKISFVQIHISRSTKQMKTNQK